ncbi:MAG: hypothetical protein ACR2JJ_01275 [Sphingomicrobium sp.]
MSAVIAFAAIYLTGFRIVSAMLLGTVVSLAVWLAVSLAGGGSLSDPSLGPALVVNGSFSLIFAAAGAALGFAASRRSDAD